MDFSAYNLIDLTQTYDPGVPGFDYQISKSIEEDGWNARNLNIYSHAGTHMDAPAHFNLPGTIENIPPDQFIGRAWIAPILIHEHQQLILVKDLSPQIINDLQPGDSLILHTNWNPEIGLDVYRDALPRISEELALWCVNRQIKMLAVEPPSVADVNNMEEVTKIHLILLGGNVVIIEGLINVDKIQKDRVILMAFPLKIKGSDGSPARVIAFEEK